MGRPQSRLPEPEGEPDSLLSLWFQTPSPCSRENPMVTEEDAQSLLPRELPAGTVVSDAQSLLPRDLPPQPPSRPPFGETGLLEIWRRAEADAVGLPIYFSAGAEHTDHDLESQVVQAAGQAWGGFYVGATTCPCRRWLGGPTPRGWMNGHACDADAMYIIGLVPAQDAPAVETRLIQFGMDRLSGSLNQARDARGQVRGVPNFIYVVVHR